MPENASSVHHSRRFMQICIIGQLFQHEIGQVGPRDCRDNGVSRDALTAPIGARERASYNSPATRHETKPRAIEPSSSKAGLKMPTFSPTARSVAINTLNVALNSSQLKPPGKR